jgi:sec-independent protein translocase protein TatB
MLNIGPPELILIFVIALVIVGPQRLPELGRTIGKWMGELRKMQDEVKDMVNTGMGDEFQQTAAELRRTATDLKSATDVRSAFRDDAPGTRPHRPVQADAPGDEASAPPGADADAPEPDERSGESEAGIEAPEAPDGPAE